MRQGSAGAASVREDAGVPSKSPARSPTKDPLVIASIIVRTRDSAATVEATFTSIRQQSVNAEIIVVDSGSVDGTLDLARRFADRVIEIPASQFSYGGTLNIGAAAASADVHVALSSHCVLPNPEWLALAASTVREPHVHGACGGQADAAQHRLSAPFEASHEYLVTHPFWGFSNHASAWSAQSWSATPFDEILNASEDKEWSWRATRHGGVIVVDPRLMVAAGHRRIGQRDYFRRVRKEALAIDSLVPLPPFSLRTALREFVSPEPADAFVTDSRRLGRTRALEVAARWSAGRRRH